MIFWHIYKLCPSWWKDKAQNKTNKNHTKSKQKKKRNNNNNSCLFHLGNSVLPEIHELIGAICQLVVIIKLHGTNMLQKVAKMTLILHQPPLPYGFEVSTYSNHCRELVTCFGQRVFSRCDTNKGLWKHRYNWICSFFALLLLS